MAMEGRAAVSVLLVGAALLIAGGLNPSVRADDAPAVEPEARAELERVAAAYRALRNYADEGRFTVTIGLDGQTREDATPLRWSMSRGTDAEHATRVRLEAGTVLVVADGERLVQAIGSTHRFVVTRPVPSPLEPEALTEGPAGAELLGGPAAGASRVLLSLWLGEDATSRLLEPGTGLAVWKDAQTSEALGLVLTAPTGSVARLRIDPETKLVGRIELARAEGPPGPDTVPGRRLDSLVLAWDAGRISTEAPATDAYQWRSEEGFTELKGR